MRRGRLRDALADPRQPCCRLAILATRAFEYAIDPSVNLSGGTRGQLFEAAQYAQRNFYHDAYASHLNSQLQEVNSWSNTAAGFISLDRKLENSRDRMRLEGEAWINASGQASLAKMFHARGLNKLEVSQAGSRGPELIYQRGSGVRFLTFAMNARHVGGGGLQTSASPIDFLVGGLATGLAKGARAGAATFAEDVLAEASGLPILPHLGRPNNLGFGLRAAHNAEIEVAPYRDRGSFSSPGQAHHLNQPELLGGAVTYQDGVTTPLVGDAFLTPGSPHFSAHRSTEAYFDLYRHGTSPGAKYSVPDGPLLGQVPTFSQYNRALYNSLQEAGASSAQALQLIMAAKREQLAAGFRGGDS